MSSLAPATIHRNEPIRMRDGAVLKCDIYLPPAQPAPALVQRTPYSKSLANGTLANLDTFRAVAAGFAILIQDVRGRFESEGKFTPFANEALDGYDTVEWVAEQTWCTGDVGMYGASYMAAAQLQAATAAPPHLRAIAPAQGSSSYYEGRSYSGGAFELGSLLSISLYALGLGSLRSLDADDHAVREGWRAVSAMLDNLTGTASTLPLIKLKETVLGRIAPFFFEWLEHEQDDEFWAGISVEDRYEDIAVPGLHISSWFDRYVVGALANFVGISMRSGNAIARENQYLLVGPWGHYAPRTALNGSARVGDLNFGVRAVADLDAVQLDWFRRWLAHDTSAGRLRSKVRYFLMGRNTWVEDDDWRPTGPHAFILGSQKGVGTLDESPGPIATASFRYDPLNPVPTLGGAHLVLESACPQGPVEQSPNGDRTDILRFTSAPMAEDLVAVGNVSLDLLVSSTAPSTDFTAKLIDVHPDGRRYNVCDGIRRVQQVNRLDHVQIQIDLGPTAHVFLKGHAICLEVSSSNFPRFDRNLNTGKLSRDDACAIAAEQTIHLGTSASSLIVGS